MFRLIFDGSLLFSGRGHLVNRGRHLFGFDALAIKAF
jgi:hypothetical protein